MTNHITIRNQKLFCTNCGGDYKLKFPLPMSSYSDKLKAFAELHKDCEKTWTEPIANQNQSIEERANWWMEYGEHGLSSETMWNFFMGYKKLEIKHPHDPDDFSRCYKLLEAIPEWKIRIPELSALSTEWKNLSENWGKLTEMFEQNQKENWENSNEIGMYEFMQELIKI